MISHKRKLRLRLYRRMTGRLPIKVIDGVLRYVNPRFYKQPEFKLACRLMRSFCADDKWFCIMAEA